MLLPRALALVLGTTLAGCALLTGAADLRTAEEGPSGAEGGPDGEDDRGSDARPDTAPSEAGVEASFDSGGDAPTATRIRSVTFESGSVVLAKDGADSQVGAPSLESASPIVGKYSVRVDFGSSVEIDFGPAPEVYITFLARFERIGGTGPVFVRIGTDTASVLELSFPTIHSSGILVQSGAVQLGPGGLITDMGPVYRVGIHLRPGLLAQTFVDVFIAPQGAAFGAAAVTGSVNGIGKVRSFQLGSLGGGGGNLRAVFDDILVDSATMPPP